MIVSRTQLARAASTLLLSTGLLTACGGGDGDGDFRSFAGNYNVTLQKFSDTCFTGLPYQMNLSQTVHQDGRRISVTSNDITLHGQIDENDAGFTTTYSDGNGGVASVVYQITENPGQYAVGFAIGATAGRISCMVTYGGMATRQ